MSASTLQERAARLLELHHGGRILVLPNAWDGGSARIVESAGFPAVATTSAGVAFTLGKADGQNISRDEMLEAVARIARSVRVPVTADMEAGYGDIAATIRGVLAAGAVGLNLEDMDSPGGEELVPLAVQTERIRTARSTGDAAGVHVVINARTDVFLACIGPRETRVERALERLRAYASAGADCLFAPGIKEEGIIAQLARELPLPLNVLATAGSPPVSRLQELGVARVSVGSGAVRAALGTALEVAEELRDHGTYEKFVNARLSYPQAQDLFSN